MLPWPPMADVLQRPGWNGSPIKAPGSLFTLTKHKDGAEHAAVCELWSHQLGWELRLLVGGELQRSQVCRTGQEWLDVKDAWHAAMVEKGWA